MHLSSALKLSAILWLCLLSFSAQAQRKPPKPRNIDLLVNVRTDITQFMRDDFGISVEVGLMFDWMPQFPNAQYKVVMKMVQQGTVVYDSREHGKADLYFDGWEMHQHRKDKYLVRGMHLIPYEHLRLEGGPQTVDLVLSIESPDTTCSDCISKTITFANRKTRFRRVRDQEYAIQKLQIDTRVAVPNGSEPAMKIDMEVMCRYPRIENEYWGYPIAWQLKDSLGRVVYDSNKLPPPRSGPVRLQAPVLPGEIVKASHVFDYRNIAVESPQKVRLVLLLIDGALVAVDSVEIPLEPPPRYNFEDQEFSATRVQAVVSDLHGVHGLRVFFETHFKSFGIVRNPKKGPYQFELQLMDAEGGEVVDFFRIPLLSHQTSRLAVRGYPGDTTSLFEGQFFVPFRFMRLPPGEHALQLRLHVSDTSGVTTFPPLGTFQLPLTMPEILRYEVNLTECIVPVKQYDVKVTAAGTIAPDLVYTFTVGQDEAYRSLESSNSFVAFPGRFTVWLAPQDKFQCELVDIDVFNKDDLIGRWDLGLDPNVKSIDFVRENQSDILSLKIKFDQIGDNKPQ